MNSQFTIVNKGLLLVALPLVVQAVFIGMLLHAQVELNNAQKWAVHTKEVIARVEEIYRRLLEGYTGIRILAVSDNPSISRPFREALDKMPAQMEELKLLTSDNESAESPARADDSPDRELSGLARDPGTALAIGRARQGGRRARRGGQAPGIGAGDDRRDPRRGGTTGQRPNGELEQDGDLYSRGR